MNWYSNTRAHHSGSLVLVSWSYACPRQVCSSVTTAIPPLLAKIGSHGQAKFTATQSILPIWCSCEDCDNGIHIGTTHVVFDRPNFAKLLCLLASRHWHLQQVSPTEQRWSGFLRILTFSLTIYHYLLLDPTVTQTYRISGTCHLPPALQHCYSL
jgi:hypothetical protein